MCVCVGAFVKGLVFCGHHRGTVRGLARESVLSVLLGRVLRSPAVLQSVRRNVSYNMER